MKRVSSAILILSILVATGVVGYYFSQPLRTTRIRLAGIVLTVELAETVPEQVKGLSDRSSLKSDWGMLFVFDHEDHWGFWMKGMKFPLDMIWFNATKNAVFIEQDLQPCTPNSCPVYVPSADAMYVLEVNAGYVATHDIILGDTFTFLSN